MYKTRQTFEQMISLSPNENMEEIKKILDELHSFGLTFFQWSNFSQPLIKKGNRERFHQLYPGYKEADRKQRRRWMNEFKENEPNHFFIEAFGYQFIRSTGETFLEISLSILDKVKKMHHCHEHDWDYTHSNGHKTCSLCGFFTRCTPEEALKNYIKGEVKLNEHETLQFDHEQPLCSCGSHQILFLNKSYFPEKWFKCVQCHAYVPPCKEEYDDYPLTTEEQIKRDFIFEHDTSLPEEEFKQNLSIWLKELHEHYLYVEQTEAPFVEWVQPYINQAVSLVNFYINQHDFSSKIEKLTLLKCDFTDTGVSLRYVITLSPQKEKIITKEDAFRESIERIAEALSE